MLNIKEIFKPKNKSTKKVEISREYKSETEQLERETEEWLENVKNNIKAYNWYRDELSDLIRQIDDDIDIAKYRQWLNKSWKETFKTAKKKLNQYKDIIKGKKKQIEHEFKVKNKSNKKNPGKEQEVNISEAEESELKRRKEQIKQIEDDIDEWQNWKSSNIASWPNQSLEQVKAWNSRDRDQNKTDQKLNNALEEAVFLRIIDNNQDITRQFLQAIASNSLSDAQITFCQSNMAILTPYFEKSGITTQVYRCIQTRGWRYNESCQTYWNIDWKTAYKKWWVTGWLNNLLMKGFPNAKPEQVSSLTNIAVAAAWIYAAYRIWKWFFGKNEEGKRNLLWKGAILAGIYFVPELLLWENWYSLLSDILTWKANYGELKYRTSNCLRFLHNNSPETYEQMAPGLLWMNIFPQNYTLKDVKELQSTFVDQKNWEDRYTVTYDRLNEHDSALAAEFKSTFHKDHYDENEWKIFLAKLWISDKTKEDTKIFDKASESVDKRGSLELWMKSQGKKKASGHKKEINNYLNQDWSFDPNELQESWFEDDNDATYTMREEDTENIEALENKVDDLSLDSDKKSELKTALKSFYNQRTIDSKPMPNDFSLKMENDMLILESHSWQQAKINLEKNELVWFGHKFNNLADLLNTADLRNKILHEQKGERVVGLPAFERKKERKWICFNNANNIAKDIISRNNSWHDTRVLSTWRLWATSKIDTLYNNQGDFATYLSDRWLEDNKIEVDINRYPIVHALSQEWIIFTNKQEVEELEARLQQIKEWKKFSIWTLNGKSYKTSWTWFDHKLQFINVNWEKETFNEDIMEKFPTIIYKENKDKFLDFMNNQNNWMRWSAITHTLKN